LSLGLIADVGISTEVSIGITIRSAKITGMAPIAKITGFTIFVKDTFSQINLGKIT
jgi:predicted RNA-binding protein with TRAM domain